MNERSAATTALRVLTREITERHFVDLHNIRREFGEPNDGESWDDFIIRIFERFDGSIYADEFFPSDANPQVGYEVEDYDPEA